MLREGREESPVARSASAETFRRRFRSPGGPLAAAAVVALASLVASVSLAAEPRLVVTPAVVELGAERPWADLAVRNDDDRVRDVRPAALSWEQDSQGTITLRPAHDVSAFPPLARIPAGETRRFRVSVHRPPGEVERAYRLALDVSDAEAGPLARALVPVFVAPAEPRVAADLRVACERGGACRVVLRNVGTVRVRPRDVSIAVAAEAGPVAELSLEAWWVLAAGERVYEVDVPPGRARVVARADLGATVLSAEQE
jgi:P pilus assembly chaperone PapD